MSSSTLQNTGLFTSRKKRKGEVDDIADGIKRPFAQDKVGRKDTSSVHGASSAPASSISSSTTRAAGAIAPCSEGNTHVQEAIHEEVQYKREGEDEVPEKTMQAYRFVKNAFVIPDNFEKNHKFGPLSGVSYEVRVVSAYVSGQLEARSTEDAGVKMCLECGKRGHFPRYCPSKLLDQ